MVISTKITNNLQKIFQFNKLEDHMITVYFSLNLIYKHQRDQMNLESQIRIGIIL